MAGLLFGGGDFATIKRKLNSEGGACPRFRQYNGQVGGKVLVGAFGTAAFLGVAVLGIIDFFSTDTNINNGNGNRRDRRNRNRH